MRTIEFRALRVDGKGWAYGSLAYLFNDKSKPYIMPSCDSAQAAFDCEGLAFGGFIPVIAETVGEFTGLQDRNGVKVFEGDVVDITGLERVVRYSDEYATFTLNRLETDHIQVYNINPKVITVTGNIHEPATVRE